MTSSSRTETQFDFRRLVKITLQSWLLVVLFWLRVFVHAFSGSGVSFLCTSLQTTIYPPRHGFKFHSSRKHALILPESEWLPPLSHCCIWTLMPPQQHHTASQSSFDMLALINRLVWEWGLYCIFLSYHPSLTMPDAQ